MKKSILLVTLAFLFMTSGFALEWGGEFNNSSQLYTADLKSFSFDQSNGVSLWLNTPLTKDNTWDVSGELLYKYDFLVDNIGNPSSKVFTQVIDPDLLKVTGIFKIQNAIPILSVGRFATADVTSDIFAQNCDGVAFSYNTLNANYAAYIGFTGLLNSLNISMLDKDGQVNSSSNNFYALSHAYLPIMLTYENLAFLHNQTLSIQGLAVLDLASTRYNRFYATASLNGPLVKSLYMTLTTSFGSENFKTLMNYSKVSFDFMNLGLIAANFSVEYASGKNAFLSPFRTVTSRTAYNSYTAPELNSVIMPSAKVMFTMDRLYADVGAKYVLGLPEKKIQNNGFEIDASVVGNVFSDLQLGLDLIYYCDIITAGADNKASATFKLIFVF